MNARFRAVIGVATSLMLGLATALTVAGLLGWFVPFGWTAIYKAEVPDRPQWRVVERFESSGASWYQSFVWWSGATGPLGSPIDNRKRFSSSRWERAERDPNAFGVDGSDGFAHMMEWGWPFRCLWGAGESRGLALPTGNSYGLYFYERQIDANTRHTREIPFAPVPLGLTLDMLTFGLPWWLVLFGIGRFRYWSRLRRNHCPHCNYNLRGIPSNSLCPECGRLNESLKDPRPKPPPCNPSPQSTPA